MNPGVVFISVSRNLDIILLLFFMQVKNGSQSLTIYGSPSVEKPENSTTRLTSGHILVLNVWVTQLYFHWTNLKGKKSYSIGRMVHYKNWKRQTKCYYDHKQIHKIPDNPWKNKRKITRPWPYHTFISRHSNPICSFLWPLKVIHTRAGLL